jgi:hypothetical protein
MQWRLFKPTSYQIRWLDNQAGDLLLAAGVPVDSTKDGLFILAEDLPRVLTALNAEVVTSHPSPFKRIDEVVLTRSYEKLGTGKVSIAYDADQERTAEADSLLTVISGELLPVVNRDIVVHLARGRVCNVVRDGRFHIFVDAAIAETQTTNIPETVFDIPISVKGGLFVKTVPVAYKSSGQGIPVIDRKTGFVAAELSDDCLYVHFDILALQPQSMQLGLFARILKQVADQLRADEIVRDVMSVIGLEMAEANANAISARFAKTPPQRFARQTLALIRSVLAKQVKMPVVIHMDAGAHGAISDAEFHVYLSGSPAKTSGVKVPVTVFGVPVAGGHNAWSLAAGSTPVKDGDFVVAQLVGMNNLYINFNPINDGVDGIGDIKAEWEVLGRILQAAVKELDVDTIIREIVAEFNDTVRLTKQNDGPSPTRIEIAVQGFSGRSLAVLTALTEQLLAPAVRMDVMVSNGQGEHRQPVDDGRFHVFFNSSPIGERCATTPAALFGIKLPSREAAFWPSGAGIGIADGTGFLVGELVGNNFYIHTQLVQAGTYDEAKLVARVMLAALHEFSVRAQVSYADTMVKAYREECLTRVKARIDNATHNPFDPNHVRQSEAVLKDAVAVTQRSERALQRLEINEQFGHEYDELLGIEKVANVTVGGGQILVDTKVLYCRDPRTGAVHEIGAFKIQIPTEGGRVRWFNQTRIVAIGDRKMNAPHVAADGHACEGTTKGEWPQFIANRQFAYVVMKAIQFIESVNTEDVWGKGINNWPVASAR